MLWVCNFFVMHAGIIFSWVIVSMNTFNRSSGRVIKNTASALWFSSHFLSVLCILYFFVACVLAFHLSSAFLVSLAVPITYTVCANIYNTIVHYLLSYHIDYKHKAVFCLYTLGGNTICYISCWLVIGIRINPLWGLTVALSVISIFAASTYAVYLYLEVIYPNGYNIRGRKITLGNLLWGTYSLPDDSFPYFLSSSDPSDDNSKNDNTDAPNRVIALLKSLSFSPCVSTIFACMTGCMAVVFFFLMVILAGPSIGGQTAAEELLKTFSLYFITAFIAWATLQKRASIELIFRALPLQNERPQNAEGQDTDHHT